ncbi:MAG: hypothetical protein NZZ41_00465 [Candidatus Dojkabacteria bacterium]|nr:hypothetical protein [Candidatus Dojkabacteria bacterium]
MAINFNDRLRNLNFDSEDLIRRYRSNIINNDPIPEIVPFGREEDFRREEIRNNIRNDLLEKELNKSKTKFVWKNNPFIKYNSYTYRWRFFMTSEDLFSDPFVDKNTIINSVLTNKGIIICETGSTSLNIKEVTTENLVNSGFWNSNTFVTKFTLKIFEPIGISLLDYLIEAADLLKVKNFARCPYFLLLDFVGIRDDGEEEIVFDISDLVTTQNFELLKGNFYSWLWKVAITNFEIDFDQSGTIYNVDLIPFNDMGFRNNVFLHKAHLTIEPVKTFGDFLEEYKRALNKQFLENNEGHRIEFVIDNNIKIEQLGDKIPSIDKNVKNWQIVPPSDAYRNIRASSMADKNATAVHAQKGANISSIILEVINSTEEAKILRKLPEINDSDFFITWIIRSEIDILNYDQERNVYNFSITYHIIPQKVPKYIIREYSAQKIDKIKDLDFLKNLNRRNLLVKRYDYLYTGLNTEVLNLNLNFNNMWASTVPLYDSRNRLNSAEPSIVITNEVKDEIEKSEKEILDLELIRRNVENSLRKTNFGSSFVENITKTIDFSRQDVREIIINSGRRVLNNFSDDINNILSQFISSEETVKEKFIRAVTNDFNKNLIEIRRRTKGLDQNLLDRNYIELSSRLRSKKIIEKNNRKYLVPVVPSIFDNRSQTSNNTEGPSPGSYGREKLIFANLLNEMNSVVDLISIDLEIRGDPFWLGVDDFNYRNSRPNRGENRFSTVNSDYYSSYVMFLLRVGLPENFENIYNTDLSIDQYENFYNGIYFVTNVESTFSGGKFTQKLKATRLINLGVPYEILVY